MQRDWGHPCSSPPPAQSWGSSGPPPSILDPDSPSPLAARRGPGGQADPAREQTGVLRRD